MKQPDEPINQQIVDEFECLTEEAVVLLLNRPRMMKKAFIKKLDIYSIVMRKKSMDPNKYYTLKLNIDVMRNNLMKKHKIKDNEIIYMMETIRNASIGSQIIRYIVMGP